MKSGVGTISLKLLNGGPNNVQGLDKIETVISRGTFIWHMRVAKFWTNQQMDTFGENLQSIQ